MESFLNFLKKTRSFLLFLLILTGWIRYDIYAFPEVYEKELTGIVLKVKTDPPYPFTTKEGHVWQCKIRIAVYDHDEQIDYIYKAYPLHGSDTEWTCNGVPGRPGLQRGDIVHLMVLMKKPENKRGEIKWLDVL